MEIQRVFEDGAQRGVSKRFTSNDTHVLPPSQLITPPVSLRSHTADSPSPESCAPWPSMLIGADPSTPQRANPAPPSSIQHFQYPQAQQIFDTTGQVAPPGVKPRVTATLWEDEGSLCFQVEVKGVCVARREDNRFINGTKLLNVAGMTRGRRDGILKSEKTRHVVKIGPLHLKGVWIPFERALDFANTEKITHLLYPLFVHNIRGLVYNPINSGITGAVMAALERRRIDSANSFPGHQSASTPLLHHNSMQNSIGGQAASIAPNASIVRPGLDRLHTFPTPPTSASSIIVNATSAPYEWGGQSVPSIDKGEQPQAVDQAMSNARSLPTTPATTPPGRFVQLVHADSEPIINERVSSERELAPSATVSPAPPPLTTCDASQSSHPSAQNSLRMTTTDIVHGPSNFPVLGLPSIRARGNSSSPNLLSPALQPHPQESSPTSATLSGNLSSTVSDTSSFDWTEDGQDPALLQLISVSCSVLLHAYLKLARKTVPSESEQQDVDGPKQTKDGVGRQQSSQRTTNSRKRKQNSSRDESDDGNDQADSKRQRSDSKGAAGFDARPLACPFNKYDNRLFGPESPDDAYHVCATCNFISIAHLKQHLQRNHYLPRYFCFRCCRRNFSSQAMLALHQREQPMCETLDPPLYRERIGGDLIEELGLDRKNLPGTDRVDYWHKVYDTFFPGAAETRPVSPYYEGPAAEHLSRFLHFSEQVLEELLPVVQQRLGLQGALSPNGQLRLQQEIQQEAGQRYLQHIASSSMPHLGRPLPKINANSDSNASQNPVSQTDPSDSGRVPSRSVTATPDPQRVNVQVAPSNGSTSSMTTASNISSPIFPRTPTISLSTQLDSQTRGGQLHPNRQTVFGPAFGGGSETGGLGAPSQNVGGDIQSLHFLNTEQLGDPVDWFDFDWEGEIEAATAFDCELPLTKDLNDTSMGRCESGSSTWEE